MTDRRWAAKDFSDLMMVLSLDLMETYERILTDSFHQPSRRTWVRTFCSQLEAFVYSSKQMLASFSGLPFVNLTAADLVYLREEAAKDGQPRPRFLPLKDNVKHLVATASRSMGFIYSLDTGEGWTAMLATIAVRDRLVHPKTAADMNVTNDELTIVSQAQDWFRTLTRELYTNIDDSLKGTV
jgi:hypothetical protein